MAPPRGPCWLRTLIRAVPTASPNDLTVVDGTLFFYASDGSHGEELWKTDGTAAGTIMVKDINPGSTSSNPFHMTAVGGTLFFAADDGIHGRELWKSDGTAPARAGQGHRRRDRRRGSRIS